MDRIGVVAVEPLREAVGRVRVPPSKSYTHRAILSSVLADGVVEVLNPLISGDTRASIRLAR
ncbi:MAG: hypothetical protein GSR86_00595, partial [Desulfurococcales archaeon]|nr:hypothetical protein [Desulfurococcales archaeon]